MGYDSGSPSQWFLNLSMHQDLLEGLAHQAACLPHPRASDSVGLGGAENVFLTSFGEEATPLLLC